MSNPSRRRYNALRQPNNLLPERLATLTARCASQKCNTSFNIPWHTKRPPLTPVVPNRGPGLWIPIAATLQCPKCGVDCNLPLPVVKRRGANRVFADEAFRSSEKWQVIVYAFVATADGHFAELDQRICSIKNAILPGISPSNWKLHFKILTHGDLRNKDATLSRLTQTDVTNLTNALFELVSNAVGKMTVTVAATIQRNAPNSQKGRLLKLSQRNLLTFSLLYLIDLSTGQGIKPEFIFDSDRLLKEVQSSDGWIPDLFEGSTLSLLYPFLSHGISVPKPLLVQPGSHIMLELADFIAFAVARDISNTLLKKIDMYSSKRLGKITYLSFDKANCGVHAHTVGFPFQILA